MLLLLSCQPDATEAMRWMWADRALEDTPVPVEGGIYDADR